MAYLPRMDALLGTVAILFFVFGIGGRRWRYHVREWWTDRRDYRALRRKYDF